MPNYAALSYSPLITKLTVADLMQLAMCLAVSLTIRMRIGGQTLSTGSERLPVVLHLISSLRVGGAERLLISSLQAALASDPTRFIVCVMNNEVDPQMRAELVGTGYPVIELNRPESHIHPKYLSALLNVVDTHGVKIIHTHNDGSSSWGMLVKLLRPSVRLIYTVHSPGIGTQIGPIKRFAYRKLVDATVAISPFIRDEAEEFGAKRVELIENGIDLARFAAVTGDRDRAAHAPFHLISLARIIRIKGQDILLDALRLALDRGLNIRLTLAGVKSDPTFYDQIIAQIERLKLGRHVDIILDPDNIPALLAAADGFVLSSREEGFGLVIVEAMAANVPVIAANTGGVPYIIEHGRNGLLYTPCDPKSLADAIATLASDPAAQQKFTQAGRVKARQFDIGETVRKHVALYRALSGATA